MTDSIISFFFSNTFLVPAALFFFIDIFLMLLISLWISRPNYIKKMDIIFSGYSLDLGMWFNSYRAFSYGMSMLFPGTLGKRVHKKVDISIINKKDKHPYILYTLSILVLFPYLIVFSFF